MSLVRFRITITQLSIEKIFTTYSRNKVLGLSVHFNGFAMRLSSLRSTSTNRDRSYLAVAGVPRLARTCWTGLRLNVSSRVTIAASHTPKRSEQPPRRAQFHTSLAVIPRRSVCFSALALQPLWRKSVRCAQLLRSRVLATERHSPHCAPRTYHGLPIPLRRPRLRHRRA